MTSLVRVEVLWPHLIPKHDVIVEIYEVVGQSRDAVQMTLNGRGAICRKVGVVGEDVLYNRHKASHTQFR